MLSGPPVSRVELGSYALLVLGVLGDHVTTTYGLLTEKTQENNPFALMLMQKGLWEITDLLLIVALIAVPYLVMRVVKKPEVKYLLVTPMLAGLIRIAVSFWNLSLLV